MSLSKLLSEILPAQGPGAALLAAQLRQQWTLQQWEIFRARRPEVTTDAIAVAQQSWGEK